MSFTDSTIRFLQQLAENNRREWFESNKSEYEQFVREPALEFIETIAPRLRSVSPHFLAIAKKSGGSLMRVYRDTRFSKDKTPYKSNIGIHFRHEFGKDVHAPGYYVHIDPEECFVGAGIWRPDSATLKKIRAHILDESELWTKTVGNRTFRANYEMAGESLKTAPMGFDKDHPLISDLRRKDYIGVAHLEVEEVLRPDFAATVSRKFKQANALMQFLCDALRVPF